MRTSPYDLESYRALRFFVFGSYRPSYFSQRALSSVWCLHLFWCKRQDSMIWARAAGRSREYAETFGMDRTHLRQLLTDHRMSDSRCVFPEEANSQNHEGNRQQVKDRYYPTCSRVLDLNKLTASALQAIKYSATIWGPHVMFWSIHCQHATRFCRFAQQKYARLQNYRNLPALCVIRYQLHGFIQSRSPRDCQWQWRRKLKSPQIHISRILEHLRNGTASIINMKCPCSSECNFAEPYPIQLGPHALEKHLTDEQSPHSKRKARETGNNRKFHRKFTGIVQVITAPTKSRSLLTKMIFIYFCILLPKPALPKPALAAKSTLAQDPGRMTTIIARCERTKEMCCILLL